MRKYVVTTLVALLAATGLVVGVPSASGAVRYCWIEGSPEGLAELKATNISCRTARRVYRRSTQAAVDDPPPTVISHGGRRWTCRASNPQRVIDGQYVNYQWKCTARGNRVSRYRWLAGD